MCVEAAFLGGGAVALRDSTSRGRPDLRFTSGEWSAFTAGVRRGEFDSGPTLGELSQPRELAQLGHKRRVPTLVPRAVMEPLRLTSVVNLTRSAQARASASASGKLRS
jgi:hypothetical protein